jgi:hypothetical protein
MTGFPHDPTPDPVGVLLFPSPPRPPGWRTTTWRGTAAGNYRITHLSFIDDADHGTLRAGNGQTTGVSVVFSSTGAPGFSGGNGQCRSPAGQLFAGK